MPAQDINLYLSLKKAPSEADYLTWRRYWVANGIFLLLMVLLYINAILSNYQIAAQLKIANADIATYEVNYNTLKSKLPQFLFSSNVNDTVNNLKKELSTQKLIINVLSNRNLFSKDFVALSNSIVSNVWLTKFTFQKNGDAMILSGYSYGIDNLHEFIDRLQKEKTFDDYEITIKQISNDDKDTNAKLTFEINMVKNSNG